MYVPRATYSLSTSFWTVPRSSVRATPCASPIATYIASRTDAGALIVIDVLIWSSGISSNTVSKSARESIATPTCPTSSRASGSSLS